MNTVQPEPFSRVRVTAPDQARAEITPHGAHVVSWVTPDGIERLFLSARSEMTPGCAIRGGVPVCFPQFSRFGPMRPHGFARNLTWRVAGASMGVDGASSTLFSLSASPATRREWDHDFVLDLWVTVGGMQLSLAFEVTNTGIQPFDFTAALHTYFRVGDIAAVTVEGLGGMAYREFGHDARQDEDTLRIVGEVDRIYWDVPGPIRLNDGERALEIAQEGFSDAVVWNPGPERAAALADMDPDGYRQMLCIEAVQIGQPVTLAPDECWRGVQQITALA